ncbi:MAG TPA: hypothetical protein VL101_00150 [Nordella sp.]|nr:hypothetical protein [Nordella sp.]
MQDIFVQSQWDTLLVYLQTGRPPIWQLLALVNGGFALLWVYLRLKGKKRLNPATIHLLRVLFIILNAAVIFREDTLRLARPFLRYFY